MNAADREVPNSYYEASRNGRINSSLLAGESQVDVVVIGGGLTGCSAALCLAEAGASVAVLESRYFGFGASGRSGGQIIAGYAAEPPTLEKLVGKDSARELWDHSTAAVDYTLERIKRHQIDCDWTRGYLHVGLKPRHAAELEEWVEQMDRDYDYSVMEYLDKTQLQGVLGSELYAGGVADPGSGHLHPLNYTLGMARAAEEAGARLYEDASVAKVVTEGGKSVVFIDGQGANGSIRCDSVVYGCNAYIDQLQPKLRSKIMPVGTYIIGTEPLGEEVARGLISNNAAVSDTNFVLDYYRLSADHRMLFGGRVSYSTLEPRKLTASLEKRMLRVFPQLAGTKVEFSWGGYVAITSNRAPHIGRLPHNHFYAQGYSGHGMALSGYMGSMLAKAVMGREADVDALKIFEQIPHKSFPGGTVLRTPALVVAMAYNRLLDRL